MKKAMLTSLSVIALSLGLASCHTMRNTSNAVVGTGTAVVDTGTAVVGSGVGFLTAGTGAVLTTAGRGTTMLIGYPATRSDTRMYHKNGVVYRNGHAYRIHHGKYVLAH